MKTLIQGRLSCILPLPSIGMRDAVKISKVEYSNSFGKRKRKKKNVKRFTILRVFTPRAIERVPENISRTNRLKTQIWKRGRKREGESEKVRKMREGKRKGNPHTQRNI